MKFRWHATKWITPLKCERARYLKQYLPVQQSEHISRQVPIPNTVEARLSAPRLREQVKGGNTFGIFKKREILFCHKMLVHLKIMPQKF